MNRFRSRGQNTSWTVNIPSFTRRPIYGSRNDVIIQLIKFAAGSLHYISDDYRNNKIMGKVTPSNFNIIIILVSLYILRASGLYEQVYCQLTSQSLALLLHVTATKRSYL